MPPRDLYDVLGVGKTASADELKSAFRKLARKHHPDVNPNNKASEEKFKEVSAAFDVLGNPEKRKLYDEFGPEAAKLGFDAEKAKAYREYARQAQSARGGAGFGGFNTDFSGGENFDIGDIFGDIFAGQQGGRGGRARRPRGVARGPVKGEDVEAKLTIDLGEAVLGGERHLQLESEADGPHNLVVSVPKGATTGTVIRLAGQGAPGLRGGPAGDVLLHIELAPHPSVRVEGRDLIFDLPISVGEALRGAEVRIPTFEGDVNLKLPSGSSSGRKLRLRSKGLPDLKGGARGDLYAVLQVMVPSPGDQEVAKLAEQIDALYKGDVRAGLKL